MGVEDDDVVQVVADPGGVDLSAQPQVLQVGAKGVIRQGGGDTVRAFARSFDHDARCIDDIVGVVARSADQGIGPAEVTPQTVVASAADQRTSPLPPTI